MKAKPSLARVLWRISGTQRLLVGPVYLSDWRKQSAKRLGLAYQNHSALKAKETPKSRIPILFGLFKAPPIVEISALLRQ
jgi:hypothetical protein